MPPATSHRSPTPSRSPRREARRVPARPPRPCSPSGNGYVIQPLTITNTSTSTINGWTVTFTLPAGHTLTGSWNGTVTTSGQTVTVRSVSHNGTLAPGAGTTSFGFQASRPNGDTALPSGYTCA
ncbi:cellulose binding domain-containing protein [Nonomuraea ferruginea]|uniref:cellulose binding domain-containing protein n=1 Tax=Nonomuraea ferruginea TaxID=46174 RepID=UPI003617CC18